MLCVCRFQASAVTDRAGDLQNDTENTHQRAEDLLSFINNVTMDIESETQDGNIIHTHTTFIYIFKVTFILSKVD